MYTEKHSYSFVNYICEGKCLEDHAKMYIYKFPIAYSQELQFSGVVVMIIILKPKPHLFNLLVIHYLPCKGLKPGGLLYYI